MNNDDSEWLREQMARVRSHLANDVGEVVEQAKELTDWRSYVRRYPWLCAGAAAAVGFLIVPARRPKFPERYDDTQLKAAMAANSSELPKSRRPSGTTQALVNLAAGIVVKSLLSVATNQLQNLVVSRANQPARGSSDWPPRRPGL